MPGCCGGASCSCKMVGSADGRLTVDGSGQPNDPFILNLEAIFAASHTADFDTTPTGTGSAADPWIVHTAYAPTAKLDGIPDVNAPGPTNGQVLAWNSATSKWVAAAPTVAPTGAVSHDTSLAGDGSPATPLGVSPITARLIGTFSTGIGLTDQGMTSVVQHFPDAASRTTGIPVPVLNSLTMLDTAPGVIQYWTGTAWQNLLNQTGWVVSDEFLELSGSYVAGSPVTVLVLQLNTTTDSLGVFDVLTPTDLAGRSGVLTVSIDEVGAPAWKAMLDTATNKVVGTAYRLDDGTVLPGQPIRATVQAVVY